MWRRFFELSEKNKEVSAALEKKGGPNAASKEKGSAPPSNEKDAGKNIPKDDKAKEEAKKMEEMKEMNAFLDKYGGPYLLRACWEFNKVSLCSLYSFLRIFGCRYEQRALDWDREEAGSRWRGRRR